MDIYADPITINCRKVLAGLKHMGVPYERKHVDYFQGQQKGDAYTALNPNQSLPAMKDGDFVLWESNAILAYAADKAGKADFYPTELQTRADIQRWLLWESSSWFPSCYAYVVENCVKPLLGAETDEAVLEAEAPRFHKLASILDERLSGQPWLAGSQPTIADFAIAAPMHLHAWAKLPLEEHGPLRTWMTERVEQLPAWRDTVVLEGFKLPSAARGAADAGT
jgi:glutathione S-transferase